MPKSVRLSMSFTRGVTSAATTIGVKVAYARLSGEHVVVLDQQRVAESGQQTLAVSVDLTSCLSDKTRIGALDACPIIVSVLLRDVSGASLDSVEVGPFEARPGVSSVPFGVNTSFADTTTVVVGDTVRIPANLNGQILNFTSSDTTVATISAAGLVTTRTVGVATITATAERGATAVRVQVSPVPEGAISANVNYTCALSASGSAFCWGFNGSGQLGNGTTDESHVPVAVSGQQTFVQISAGGQSACAVTTRFEIYCWGSGGRGGLGIGSLATSTVPVRVSGGQRYKSVHLGSLFACGLTLEGAAYCWGANSSTGQAGGMLGTGDTVSTTVPVPVAGGLTFRSIGAGGVHACGVTLDNKAYCWGSNSFATLGLAASPVAVLVPTPVDGGFLFSRLYHGFIDVCGIAITGPTYCWGDNVFGSLGNGLTASTPRLTPAPLAGGISFRMLNLGPANSFFTPGCGFSLDGTAYCWGSNSNGQLGTTAALPDSCTLGTISFACTGTPTAVSTSEKFTSIATGSTHTCGITTTHRVMCWGDNTRGALGDGTTISHGLPTVVAGFRAP